ncbi:MAG: KH domain-containing protein [Deltaproteobacteria bacterium]|nr:KH domain-containing protein [Deltaproteobacteria bacterium]
MTQELLQYLAVLLVDFPDDVRVQSETTPEGTILRLSVRREDVGKAIGKQGRTARALRNLVHAAATVRGERVNVQFVDA